MFCNIYKNLVERNRIVVKKNDKMSPISHSSLYILIIKLQFAILYFFDSG